MLGWFIIVSSQTPEQRTLDSDREKTLATWEAGIGGIRWLSKLVAEGKAIQLRADGYPSRYAAMAGDVLPFLVEGPPPVNATPVFRNFTYTPAGRLDQARIDRKKLERCPLDQQLTIDAWDQS